MEVFKREWKKTFDEIQKEEIKWKWLNTYDGIYEGEMKELLFGKVPHGYGRWAGKYREFKLIIEGEWKDGEVHEKAVNYYDDGEEVQWQTKDG